MMNINCTSCERPFGDIKRSNHYSHNGSYFEEPEPLKEDRSHKYWFYSMHSQLTHSSHVLCDL